MFQPQARNDFIWFFIGSPWGLLGCWLLLISLVTFLVFGLDKWKARRKEKKESVRRVPERTLFLLAGLGGSVGALLGMKVFHHKTLHKSFRLGIPAILILQVLLIGGLWVWLTFLR
ncbi:DUF1294 domain-containing protein [Dysosmobacter sp.]|uniref:DUF1294 domain-containing protein n=1 Tax=Dysosmobacter sp. TaxID=2591382 RepID=UPI002A879B86|nr:DUF1294 domain-containing protein [Dysosmobacter sp.]MDY3280929.1 DUF1294 domain-containing protein [Dysosmobacter sp.]